MPAPTLDHLSYSSITTYLMCPRSWRYRYILKEPTPTAPALLFGSAFHDAIESYIRSGRQLELVKHWSERWQATIAEEKAIAWGDDSPEAMCNVGVKLLSHPDVIGILDSIKPLPDGLERKVELRVPGVPIPIIGYVDCIEEDGVPADFKTSAKSWSQEQANSEIQTLFYLAALNQAGVAIAPDLKFRHYVFLKTKTPQVQVWETTHTWGQVAWLFGLVQDVYHGIVMGVYPGNPGTWKCSARHCEYWHLCRGRAL